jgi:recombination associated protein RdgC
VGTSAAKRADGVVTRLVEQLGGGLRLALVQTALSPARAMAQWLLDKEAPPGFTLDRECELKQPDSEKATVRYARHTLDIDEVGEHIRQGKLPTQLALTWNGRVSFVLTDGLALKKIQLLDGVLEGADADQAGGAVQDEGFDADVAIATGELRQLWPDLLEALGGLEARQADTTAPATAAVADAAADQGAPWAPVPA